MGIGYYNTKITHTKTNQINSEQIKMKQVLKRFLQILPIKWQNEIQIRHMKNQRIEVINQWKSEGSPLPPPHSVKQMAIENVALKHHIKTLVETGTYLGDMVMAEKNNFDKIISIELGKDLWATAVERFSMYDHIKIYQGDSGKVLHEIIDTIEDKALFWLDGHYSSGVTAQGDKDCPIYEELDAIFSNNKNHVILIDDARHFNGTGDYPTIEALQEYVNQQKIKYTCEVADDIIRFEC